MFIYREITRESEQTGRKLRSKRPTLATSVARTPSHIAGLRYVALQRRQTLLERLQIVAQPYRSYQQTYVGDHHVRRTLRAGKLRRQPQWQRKASSRGTEWTVNGGPRML